MNGIILAGGRATRLGPLTAQMNKSLVSVGQRPMIAHHLDMMRRKGVTRVVVVTSPESQAQVHDVVARSHDDLLSVEIIAQKIANGPLPALMLGARRLMADDESNREPVLAIMADTYIDADEVPDLDPETTWIGVAPAPREREWCGRWRNGYGGAFYSDGLFQKGDLVTIGVYGFRSLSLLQYTAFDFLQGDPFKRTYETGMQNLLTGLFETGRTREAEFKTWLDVGDVTALAMAKRSRFITRSVNSIELDDRGMLVKRGATDDIRREANWLNDYVMSPAPSVNPRAFLFPRVFWTQLGHGTRLTEYAIEHVDLPTLAELYMYWPGRPDMWSDVLSTILTRLKRDLWAPAKVGASSEKWALEMYRDKPFDRLAQHGSFDTDLIEELADMLSCSWTPQMVVGHGDLNFGNILYSLGTGTFKLIDPRGDPAVDLGYELAKLRYSYRDGFSAICHDLFRIDDDQVIFGTKRDDTAGAMDEVLSEYCDGKLQVIAGIEATLFLSAVPLHAGDQQRALYLQGCKLAQEALS